MSDKLIEWIEQLKRDRDNPAWIFDVRKNANDRLYAIRKLACFLEEEVIVAINNMNPPDLSKLKTRFIQIQETAYSPQDLTSGSREIVAHPKCQSLSAAPKPKCSLCGIYEEVHGTMGHDFKVQ